MTAVEKSLYGLILNDGTLIGGAQGQNWGRSGNLAQKLAKWPTRIRIAPFQWFKLENIAGDEEHYTHNTPT